MAYSRAEVPELENLMKYGKKKFVRYDEGAKLYSMGLHSFQELAKEANAVYHVKRIVLVNTEVIDEYLENFRDEQVGEDSLLRSKGQIQSIPGQIANEALLGDLIPLLSDEIIAEYREVLARPKFKFD